MSRFDDLYLHGQQSAWVDNIRREWLDDGTLEALLNQGVRGVTSNPSIFAKAVGTSSAYDEFIASAIGSDEEVFEQLAIRDVADACAIFRPVYDASLREFHAGTRRYTDGYVSLEVSPRLAHDTDGTIAAAKRLAHALRDHQNLMIKIPATKAGLPAIVEVLGSGICVNVTLIFSLERYRDVIRAFKAGVALAKERGLDLDRLASVASFFVSRVDTAIDPMLPESSPLRGRIALAQVAEAYDLARSSFANVPKGTQVQRALWASTSTKNPDYDALLYVDSLIAPETVNTIPDATLSLYGERGSLSKSILADETLRVSYEDHLDELAELGIDLGAVTDQLEVEGVSAFAVAYEELLETVRAKRASL
jgi:transaldolase